MKHILLSSLLLLFCMYTPAYAQSETKFNVYLSGKTGYSATFTTIQDEAIQKKHTYTLSSFNIGAAFGAEYYVMTPFGLRMEFEYLFRTKSETKSKAFLPNTLGISTHSMLTNIYIDWHIIPHSIALYTQAGVGYGIISMNYESKDRGDNYSYGSFIWQAGAGAWYKVTQNIVLDLGIRYIGYSSRNIQTINVHSLGSLDVQFSVRYNF